MWSKTWFRVLVIGVVTLVVLGAVGFGAYRLGYQAAARQQFAQKIGENPRTFGNFLQEGPRFGFGGFPSGRMFPMMRHGLWGFHFGFHPFFILGLIAMVLLVVVPAKAFSAPKPAASESRSRSRR